MGTFFLSALGPRSRLHNIPRYSKIHSSRPPTEGAPGKIQYTHKLICLWSSIHKILCLFYVLLPMKFLTLVMQLLPKKAKITFWCCWWHFWISWGHSFYLYTVLAFQTRRRCCGNMDWAFWKSWSQSGICQWWPVLYCGMWIKLCSCSLSKSKNDALYVGEVAERAQAQLLRVKSLPKRCCFTYHVVSSVVFDF